MPFCFSFLCMKLLLVCFILRKVFWNLLFILGILEFHKDLFMFSAWLSLGLPYEDSCLSSALGDFFQSYISLFYLYFFFLTFWSFYEINMGSWGFILYVSTFLSYFLFSFDCMMCVNFLYFSVIFLVSKNNLVSISFLFWREKVLISSQISLGVLSSFLLYQVSCFLCSSWSFSFGFLLFLR